MRGFLRTTSRWRHRCRRMLAGVGLSGLLVTTPLMGDDELTVLLDWFINPDHATLILAQELGYFEDVGLTVTLVEPVDPSLPPKMVAAGKADIAVTYQPQLHVQVAEGLPLTRIATLISTPLNSLVVLESGPIEQISDLQGSKVGYSVGGFEDALLKRMLETHGLSLSDVELVNVNFSLSPSIIAGQVDAVIGAFRNFELNQMDIEGHPGRGFYPEEEGVPVYDELILVVNNRQRDDARYIAFMTAIERATIQLMNHPEAAWNTFRDSDPQTLDNELNRRAWRDTLRRFALRPAALDHGRYDDFARFMKEQSLIDDIPPLESYAIELR